MRRHNFLYLRALFVMPSLLIVLIIISAACKKSPEEKREYGWFEFVIPDSDTTRNAVDMSFLNEGIAGGSGFVKVENGHFVDGKGERIRFFGTNLTFSSAFPDKKTAIIIAGRLRELGMNVVRFHHMDNGSKSMLLIRQATRAKRYL